MAKRLRGSVRASDTVARYAGDEFTMILRHIVQRDDVLRIAGVTEDGELDQAFVLRADGSFNAPLLYGSAWREAPLVAEMVKVVVLGAVRT